MKKRVFVSAFAVLLAFVLLLSGCAKPKAKYFVISAEKKSYAPGEELAVAVSLNNVENVAMFDLTVNYDPEVLTLDEAEDGNAGDFILLVNPENGQVLVKGFCATTYDFTSETVAMLYFTVNEGASGSTELQSTATMFAIGTDDRGDETVDLTEKNNITASLKLDIAG